METAGRLGHLTPEQQDLLQEFKGRITGAYIDDNQLLRFLRARQFDLDNAAKMFNEYLAWRAEFGTDQIIATFEFPELSKVLECYPRCYHKTDKYGRPIYVERLGMANVTQLFKITTSERLLKNHVYGYEKLVNYRLPACSLKQGCFLEQSTTILDLKGVSLSTFSSVYSLVSQVSTIAQNYYPEMLGKMYIINAPYLFSTVWSLVKVMLHPVTQRKIAIVGSSYLPALQETIPLENIPDFLGGSCSCPGGCASADVGPWNDGSVPGYPKPEFELMKGTLT
jgi:hypothetical protein